MHPYPATETQIISVSGSDYEMGYEHASQLGEAVSQGMGPFFHRFFRQVLNPPLLNPLESFGFSVISKAIDPFLIGKLVSQIPAHLRERIRGVSEGCQLPEKQFLTAFVLPDLLPMLQAHWIRFKPHLAVPVASPPQLGCSSFVAKGAQFLQGRNLDFPGVAYWDRFQVLQLTEPKKGFRYVGITSAGVPLAGISGVNEVGISVAIHQHYCLKTNWRGSLPFVVAEKILNEADNLETALGILREAQLASSWAFIVSDGKTQDAFIYEAQPEKYGVRWLKEEQGVLTHTNYYQSPNCQSSDYATSERMNWDNFSRNKTLEKIIRNHLEQLSPEIAVKALSDHTDDFWEEEKTVNRTVSQVYNIQSYVLDPTHLKLYLAEGNCPVHLGRYQEYDLKALFEGENPKSQQSLRPYEFKNPQIRTAKEDYILSFVAAFDQNFSLAYERLEKSLSSYFVPEAALVASLVNMRNGGGLDTSLDWLKKAESEIEIKMKKKGIERFPPEYFEVLIYQARALDLKGRRREALNVYKQIEKNPFLRDQNLLKLAHLAGPYTKKKVGRMIMPYSTYIPFE
jgi:predicted choloylglycine hydrolase